MSLAAPAKLAEADYEAIEAAVMETARGRWFLGEYARRHRHADTEMLIGAMARLEDVVRSESLAAVDRTRNGLVDMATAIARAKADIAALKPEGEAGRIEEATEELDSVVHATEAATGDILAAAEQIQEIAWTMREQNIDESHCDALDTRATDIYTACSFQDLTGQRTRKVIALLRYLEERIETMISLWGSPEKPTENAAPRDEDAQLLNGPARPGQGLMQQDVDVMMDFSPRQQVVPGDVFMVERADDDAAADELAAAEAILVAAEAVIAQAAVDGEAEPVHARNEPDIAEPVIAEAEIDEEEEAADAAWARALEEGEADGEGDQAMLHQAVAFTAASELVPDATATMPEIDQADPLQPLELLSREEKIALFT